MLETKRIDDPWSMKFDFAIHDLARLLASDSWLDRVRDRVRQPLGGIKLVAYYGCQVVRPPKITGYADYENPMHLDRLVEASGALAVDWSYKGTCCGASMGIPKKEIGLTLVTRLLAAARASGADAVVVCCPLCQSNLDLFQPEIRKRERWDWELPVLYYTELLGIAFGLPEIQAGLASHLVDPRPLFNKTNRPVSESSRQT
jgi:heterodisulfide reductase subunit B